MTKAIRFHQTGGPEVLQWEDVEVGDPGPGQIRIRHTAIGVNFIDTYQRSGLYPLPLPCGAGNEAAGVVEAVGPGVTGLKPGDRVAYTGAPPGSYCDVRLYAADRLVKVPEGISDQQAASIMLKGTTAWYLIHRTYAVKPGDMVLFHAAAGGVGSIAVQWLKALGAQVIGTVGSDEKAALVKKLGCDHVIVYSRENFAERVKAITGGKGLPVVYDSVGKSTWEGSLDCLRPRGMMVSFGNASGAVPPFSVNALAAKGSVYVTRPTLFTHLSSQAAAQAMGVKVLTLYTFSTENWHRPQSEVSVLMRMLTHVLKEKIKKLKKNNVKFLVMGRRERIPEEVMRTFAMAVEETKDNTGLIVNLAFNYGARLEMVDAVRHIAEAVTKGQLRICEIDETLISDSLYTKGLPDPDLLIRTSGEQRISNFLLWQISYTELYFTKKFWPDFTAQELKKAVSDYQGRERRYGAT